MKTEELRLRHSVHCALKCLYAIKDDDKFYFMEYGKNWIEDLVKREVSKRMKSIPPDGKL